MLVPVELAACRANPRFRKNLAQISCGISGCLLDFGSVHIDRCAAHSAVSRENRNERPDPGWPNLTFLNSIGRSSIENGHSYFQVMVNRAGLEPATRC